MINVSLNVRRAVPEDRLQVANLGMYEANMHRHLDWRSAFDWLGSPNYWVLEEAGRITAALSCPEDPPHTAWIRLFGHQPHLTAPEAWSALWSVACREVLSASPQTQIAAIVVKQWFQRILLASGFESKQNIILLQLDPASIRTFPAPRQMHIRPMLETDLPAVTAVDLEAFGPFWHNTIDSLSRARLQAIHATVAEDASGLIGYQISTGNPFGAHLARLGVRAEAQGRGVGTALVGDLIQQLGAEQLGRVSVNTQSDNAVSLALYQKMGFKQTGEYFPVLVYPSGSR